MCSSSWQSCTPSTVCVSEHARSGFAGDRFAIQSGWRLQPGWRGARAVRLASRSTCAHRCTKQQNRPTCLDSTGKGRVIDFIVVSEELHTCVKEVAVDESPTVIQTHRPVVLTLDGVNRGRLVQRLRRPARLPRVVPVGPSRRLPNYVALLDMVSMCGQRHHSDVALLTTLKLLPHWSSSGKRFLLPHLTKSVSLRENARVILKSLPLQLARSQHCEMVLICPYLRLG